MTRHLWEIDHPYYCNETNRHVAPNDNGGHHVHHESWEAFLADQGDLDPERNLVFRWDWKSYETHDELSLFVILQRLGDFWCHTVTVSKDDEADIGEWLAARARHIAALWEPFTLAPADTSDAPRT